MATAPFIIDETSPSDADIVSQFPADERNNRDVIESYLNVEHDPNSGHHKLPVVSQATRDGISDWVVGSSLYNTTAAEFEVVTATGPFTFSPAMPSNYSEGSWTPSLKFGGASVGITYTTQVGRYVKIGNVVHIFGRITTSSKGSSVGDATVSGIPFNPATVTNMIWSGTIGIVQGMDGLESTIDHRVDLQSGGTELFLRGYQPFSELDFEIDNVNFGSVTDFTFNLTYITE